MSPSPRDPSSQPPHSPRPRLLAGRPQLAAPCFSSRARLPSCPPWPARPSASLQSPAPPPPFVSPQPPGSRAPARCFFAPPSFGSHAEVTAVALPDVGDPDAPAPSLSSSSPGAPALFPCCASALSPDCCPSSRPYIIPSPCPAPRRHGGPSFGWEQPQLHGAPPPNGRASVARSPPPCFTSRPKTPWTSRPSTPSFGKYRQV
ncbi:hypothetical protein VPH35_054145 [Triticum aestivum]